ncbi:NAD-dependent protein deacetylase srt2, partial [Cymbomonas tetramitiformis]
KCNSRLMKPDVVFFGDNLPPSRTQECLGRVQGSDALLVVGSSLMVFSAFRLARAATENSIPLAILNIGETRADQLARLKVEGIAGQILSELVEGGHLP